MRNLAALVVSLLAGLACVAEPQARTPAQCPAPAASEADAVVADALARRGRHVAVAGNGVVIRLLPDDDVGSRHQRFIVALASGRTLLVAHNVDLAPRIRDLRRCDLVQFSGRYEWNPRGGVLHWTHRDPAGAHPGGWLRHNGRTYQ